MTNSKKFTKSEKILLFLMALTQFNHIVDFVIMMPLGQTIMRVLSISPQQFSWLVSAYTFAAAVSGFLASMFVDRFDRKNCLMFFYTGFIIGTFGCSLADTFEMLLLARGFTGFFGGVIASLIFSMISDTVPYERRATALGIIMGSFSLASIIGVPVSLKLATMYSWNTPFTVLGFLAMAVLVMIYFKVPAMRGHLNHPERNNPWGVLKRLASSRNQQIALLFMFSLVMGQFAIIPFISASLVANAGYPEADLPFLYLFGGLASIIASVIVGRMSDKYGKLKVFGASAIISVVPILLITNIEPHPLWLLITIASCFFITISGRMVPATTMISSSTAPEHRGSFMSISTSTQQLSAAVASTIAGLIVVKDSAGHLEHFAEAGYLAIGFTLVALVISRYLKVHEETAGEKPHVVDSHGGF